MSNRLAQAGRLPLVPEPLIAARAGALFAQSRLQSARASEIGHAFLELPFDIINLVRALGKAIDNAVRLRQVAWMDDRLLADIGVRRDQLPALLIEGRLADVADRAVRRKDVPAA